MSVFVYMIEIRSCCHFQQTPAEALKRRIEVSLDSTRIVLTLKEHVLLLFFVLHIPLNIVANILLMINHAKWTSNADSKFPNGTQASGILVFGNANYFIVFQCMFVQFPPVFAKSGAENTFFRCLRYFFGSYNSCFLSELGPDTRPKL